MIDTILAKSVQAITAGAVSGALVFAGTWALGFPNDDIRLATNSAVVLGLLAPFIMAHRGK